MHPSSPDAPTVRVDPHRFAEALGNLLDNALRHTPPGGQSPSPPARPPASARTWPAWPSPTPATDSTPPTADRLFERFYRTDAARTRSTGGSGIGLTITKAIITAHHGTITAHSDGPGHGATFTITLPATAAADGRRFRT